MTAAPVPAQGVDTPSFRDLLAGEVRAHLARRRWSNRQFARQLGVQPTWIDRRLNGTTPMDADDIELFAATLGLTPAQLMAGALAPDVAGGVTRVESLDDGAVVIPFPQRNPVVRDPFGPDGIPARAAADVPRVAGSHPEEIRATA